MSNEQFTPGPWAHTSYEGWDAVEDSHRQLICKLVANNPANATLIAAAPELLRALRDANAVLACFANGHIPRLDDPAWQQAALAWQDGCKAVQKAGAQ